MLTPLSWLIYLAGVVNSFMWIFGLATVGLVIAIFISVIGILNSRHISDNEDAFIVVAWKKMKWFFFGAIGMGLIASAIPGQKTVMYIAASEYGQILLQNPKVQDISNDAMNLLQTWIQEQTKELKGEKKPETKDKK